MSKSVNVLEDVIYVFLVYNQERYIKESLTAAMTQTCYPATLVIMDDASPDNSHEKILECLELKPAGLEVEYLRNEKNIGLVSQLNKLVDQYQDKLIVLQAADDLAYPQRLETTHREWVDNGKPSLVLGNYDRIDEEGAFIEKFSGETKPQKSYTMKRLINRRAMVYGCCAAFHSDLINFFGPINADVINEDRVNAFRALLRNGIHYIHKPLIGYRSEVGISAFRWSSSAELRQKMHVESNRELADLKNHSDDLSKLPDAKLGAIIDRRRRLLNWVLQLPEVVGYRNLLQGILQGLSLKDVWKIFKKLSQPL